MKSTEKSTHYSKPINDTKHVHSDGKVKEENVEDCIKELKVPKLSNCFAFCGCLNSQGR